MLEIHPTATAVIAIHADRVLLDRLAPPAGAHALRIAPDESWWVGPPTDRAGLLERARRAAASADGLALDQSDGWDVWTVRGDQGGAVFDRLMLAPIPDARPAFVQGAITGVPGKVLALTDAAHVFVPGPVGHHLVDRIRAVCADLGPVTSEARPFSVGGTR